MMCVAGGWKVACRSGRMIERCCVTSPAHLCGSVKSGHEITTVREWLFYLHVSVFPPS